MNRPYLIRGCAYCGPRKVINNYQRDLKNPDTLICPTCGLDPAEIKMIEAVRTYGFEECLRRELAHEEL